MKYFICVILTVLFITDISHSQIKDSIYRSDLNLLLKQGLQYNSALDPIEWQRNVELLKAGSLNKQPMPMIEFMVDYIPFDFMAKPEYGVMYSQKLMLVKLNDMSQMSVIRARKQEITKEVLKVDLTRQIKNNYFDVFYYDRLISFNTEYQKIMKGILFALENNYATGMGSQNQILQMSNEINSMILENLEMNNMKKVSINKLRLLTNSKIEDDFTTADLHSYYISSRDVLSGSDTIKLFSSMLSNNPEFRMYENMIQETALERRIAENDKIPDITLRGGIKYMANESMTFMTFGIGIDLPFVPWNQKRIEAIVNEKTLTEKQVLSEKQSLIIKMKNDMQNMLIMIANIDQKIRYISEVIIPQSQTVFNSLVTSFSANNAEFMNLIDAYRKLREADESLVKEEINYLKQISELEFMLGSKITDL